jgi:hypothetical protein
MFQIKDHEPPRKIDDDAYVVRAIAARFRLEPHIARLIVEHSGLGASDDRPSAGRTA